MKILLWAPALLTSLNPPLAAAAPQTCNVMLDVIDPDIHGTNIRATPGGTVVATLAQPQQDDWIEVHVIGQEGDWFLIDRADQVGDAEKTIFRGRGYMHRSVLGADGLVNGEPIRADHDVRSARILTSANADQPVALLGCWGDFLHIRIDGGTGWTKTVCRNQRTTCA